MEWVRVKVEGEGQAAVACGNSCSAPSSCSGVSTASVHGSTRGSENQAPRQLTAACVACGAAWIRSQPASGSRLQPKTEGSIETHSGVLPGRGQG